MPRHLLLIALFLATSIQLIGQEILRINEVVSDNYHGHRNELYQAPSDWIEFYNPGNDTITLDEYYLSDKITNLKKWRFPSSISIPAKQYLIVYADAKDPSTIFDRMTERKAAYMHYRDFPHSNFKVSKNGESLYLSMKNTAIDSVTIPTIPCDHSYALFSDGWKTSSTTTPGASNSFSEVFSFSVNESLATRNWKDSTLVLEFNRNTNSLLLSDSLFEFNDTYQLRETKDHNASLLPGEYLIARNKTESINTIVSHPQVYFNPPSHDGTRVLALWGNETDIWDEELGIYAAAHVEGRKNWQRPGIIQLYAANKQLLLEQSVEYRLHGQSALENEQKSLAVFARDPHKGNSFEFDFMEDGERTSYDSFVIRSGSDDYRRLIYRDYLSQKILEGSFEVPLQKASPVILYINGKYHGFHFIRERFNENYISQKYSLKKNEFDLLKNHKVVMNGSKLAYSQLIGTIRNKDLSEEERLTIILPKVDWSSIVDFSTAQIFIGNRSWSHNYKYWKEISDEGKWKFILYDCDRGFAILEENTVAIVLGEFELLRFMLLDDDFRDYFLQRASAQLNFHLTKEHVQLELEKLETIVSPHLNTHRQRWDIKLSREKHLKGAEDFILNRHQFVFNSLQKEFRDNKTDSLSISIPNTGVFTINGVTIKESGNYLFWTDRKMTIACSSPQSAWSINGIPQKGDEAIWLPNKDGLLIKLSYKE